MRAVVIAAAMLAGAALAGCNRQSETVSTHHGRYLGVGVYSAGELWARLVAARPAEAAKARIGDDEQVIVVVDSDTGEVRQCGNLSGYCIGVNPWAKALAPSQAMPVDLGAHAAEPPAPGATPAR